MLFWRGERPPGPEAQALLGDAHTVHAIEWGRLEQVRSARVLIRMRNAAPPGR